MYNKIGTIFLDREKLDYKKFYCNELYNDIICLIVDEIFAFFKIISHT